ncbi:MAG: sigma-70 family RNA polymerase sigma factor [Planctomycetota bacterium]
MTDSPHSDPRALLRHRELAYGVALSLLRDQDVAEDVAQEACLASLTHPPPRRPVPWLTTIARHLALDVRRGERRRRAREEKVGMRGSAPSTIDVVERVESVRRIVEGVMRLPEPFRQTVFLRYYDDLEAREISDRLHVPLETVRSRLKRGLARLREDLEHHNGREGTRTLLLSAVASTAAASMAGPAAATTAAFGGLLMSTVAKVVAGAGIEERKTRSVSLRVPIPKERWTGQPGGEKPPPYPMAFLGFHMQVEKAQPPWYPEPFLIGRLRIDFFASANAKEFPQFESHEDATRHVEDLYARGDFGIETYLHVYSDRGDVWFLQFESSHGTKGFDYKHPHRQLSAEAMRLAHAVFDGWGQFAHDELWGEGR